MGGSTIIRKIALCSKDKLYNDTFFFGLITLGKFNIQKIHITINKSDSFSWMAGLDSTYSSSSGDI